MRANSGDDDFIDVEHLKRYMDLSPEKKLEILEEMRDFFWVSMPEESKKVWEKLKEKGW
ncbi:MAG: hypothetical protein HYY52_05510 [Candidatus Melainabacteria bacterium]|nr:hypothetical protein [Candidatus Melainabacteria bacterium]